MPRAGGLGVVPGPSAGGGLDRRLGLARRAIECAVPAQAHPHHSGGGAAGGRPPLLGLRPSAPGHSGERGGRPPRQPRCDEWDLRASGCAPGAHEAPGRGLLLGGVGEGVGECWLCRPPAGVQALRPEPGSAAHQRVGQGTGGPGPAAPVWPLPSWVLPPQVPLGGDCQM